MKTLKTSTLILAALMLWGAVIASAAPAIAASNTATVNLNASVVAKAKLSLSASTLTFPGADPDITPSITATEGAVTVTAKAQTGTSGAVSLTLLAGDDLKSGSDTIGISNVTWTVSGTGFQAGTMNKTTPQTVASWTGSGNRTGTITHALANSWTYVTGTYTATATYTLTAP